MLKLNFERTYGRLRSSSFSLIILCIVLSFSMLAISMMLLKQMRSFKELEPFIFRTQKLEARMGQLNQEIDYYLDDQNKAKNRNPVKISSWHHKGCH